MRWRVYLIWVAILIYAGPTPLARAQDTSNQSLYLKIYLKINEADDLQQQGDLRGALADYKDCLKRLLKLQASDPHWESALVIQRIADCKFQIANLQPKVDALPLPSEPAPNDAGTPPDQGAGTNPTPVAPDVASLQAQLESVKEELNDTKEKLRNALVETQTYRDQLTAVNQQLDALKSQQSVDDRVGKLMDDNKTLTDKLAAAQKQLELVKSPEAMKLLQAKLKNTEDQLSAEQAANMALQQTTDTLKTQLDQAQNDLSAANQKLAAIPTSSPEYATIKHENEIMRGILLREVQEQSRRDGAKRLAQEEFDRLKIASKVLQEQLDILGSPMTPPANDDERMVLASLKGPGMDVTQPGNILTASNNPNTTQDDSTTNTPPPSVPTPSDTSTNPPPTTVVDNTVSPTNAAPAVDPNAPAPTPAPSTSDTNVAPSAPVTPVDTDTNAPTDTNTSPTLTPAVTPPATNAADVTPAPTPTPVPIEAPTDNTTNAPPTPPSPSDTDTNAKTVTQLPATTTTYTDTTIQNNNTSQQSDPTQYSTKPRLPDDMRDTAQEAADLFKKQDYDAAADKYQSIIDKYPESLYAWSNLGVVRFQQGKLDEALKALQQSVKLSPTDAFSYMNLGIVYYQLNQYENAIDALNRAIALDPNNAKAHNYLGCACSQKGWQEVAEQQFRKAIDIDETFGDAHFNLALVYAIAKPPSLELARRHYNRAIELGIAKDPRLEKLLQQ